MPHSTQLVFQASNGAFVGQPGECEFVLHRLVSRPFVCAMKFVQIKWLSESGK